MFGAKPKSGALMLLESLLPEDIWQQIQKATTEIPLIVSSVKSTMQSIDARLELIQMKLDALEKKIDPSVAESVTALSLLDERVKNNSFSSEDEEIMKHGRLTDEDIAMLDVKKPN